jgi:hypothetical protein
MKTEETKEGRTRNELAKSYEEINYQRKKKR